MSIVYGNTVSRFGCARIHGCRDVRGCQAADFCAYLGRLKPPDPYCETFSEADVCGGYAVCDDTLNHLSCEGEA